MPSESRQETTRDGIDVLRHWLAFVDGHGVVPLLTERDAQEYIAADPDTVLGPYVLESDHLSRAVSGGDENLTARIAAELRRNDACGSGPVSDQEYWDDATAIVRIVHAHQRGSVMMQEPRQENTRVYVRVNGEMMYVPEDAVTTLVVCKLSGQVPHECGLYECDNGCSDEELTFVRAEVVEP